MFKTNIFGLKLFEWGGGKNAKIQTWTKLLYALNGQEQHQRKRVKYLQKCFAASIAAAAAGTSLATSQKALNAPKFLQ